MSPQGPTGKSLEVCANSHSDKTDVFFFSCHAVNTVKHGIKRAALVTNRMCLMTFSTRQYTLPSRNTHHQKSMLAYIFSFSEQRTTHLLITFNLINFRPYLISRNLGSCFSRVIIFWFHDRSETGSRLILISRLWHCFQIPNRDRAPKDACTKHLYCTPNHDGGRVLVEQRPERYIFKDRKW